MNAIVVLLWSDNVSDYLCLPIPFAAGVAFAHSIGPLVFCSLLPPPPEARGGAVGAPRARLGASVCVLPKEGAQPAAAWRLEIISAIREEVGLISMQSEHNAAS